MTDVENAGMEVQERRLRFLTLHLHDLFSLRGAPLWLMLMPLKERVSPWVDQIGYCLGMIVELRWSRFLSNFIERRYGKTTLTREERRRQAFPHRIVALATLACPCAWLVCRVWYGRGTAMEVGLYSLVLLIFLRKISDGTNPALRRYWVECSSCWGCSITFYWSALPDRSK